MFECSAGRHWFRSSASIGQGRHLKSTGSDSLLQPSVTSVALTSYQSLTRVVLNT